MENKTVYSVFELVSMLQENACNALLIGATVGARSLYCELKACGLEQRIAIWTDEKYAYYKLCGLPVEDPANMKTDYDLVIIGGKRAEKFAKGLLAETALSALPVYRVDEKRVGTRDFPWKNLKYTDTPVDDHELIQIDPWELLSEKRMGFVIRYLAAMEILNGVDGDGLALYRKYIYFLNGYEEFVKPFSTCAYFSDYEEKKGMDCFIHRFEKLLYSVKENGFDKRHFIPVSEKMSLLNGAHRMIAALIFGQKIWIKRYEGFGEPFIVFGIEDLQKLDCTEKQVQLVADTYQKLIREGLNIKDRGEL